MSDKILEIKDLHTSFFTHLGEVKAVSGVSFDVNEGEIIAIVGESGSGKSVTALSIMNLVPDPGKIKEGSILFDGREIANKSEKEMLSIRGKQIGMIFQDPMTSLNPVLTIGRQITEMLWWHNKMDKTAARNRGIELLKLVGMSNPEKRMKQYPHELSGGMRQRVMIAIALSCDPKFLIADEPTTALDVTIQAQIMDLIKGLNKKLGTSVMIITHDLGVVAGIANRVIVMYGGKIVEKGMVRDIYYHSRHPYTWGILNAVPKLSYVGQERLTAIEGQPPDMLNLTKGCAFCERCNYAMEVCKDTPPDLYDVSEQHQSRCWLLHPDAPSVERKE